MYTQSQGFLRKSGTKPHKNGGILPDFREKNNKKKVDPLPRRSPEVLTVSRYFFLPQEDLRRLDRRERSRAFERPALGSSQSYCTAAAVLWTVEVSAASGLWPYACNNEETTPYGYTALEHPERPRAAFSACGQRSWPVPLKKPPGRPWRLQVILLLLHSRHSHEGKHSFLSANVTLFYNAGGVQISPLVSPPSLLFSLPPLLFLGAVYLVSLTESMAI